MNGFREKFKGVDFGTKNDPFPHFGHQKFFSKKSSVTFLCLSNPNFTQKIRKKVMGQSWENSITDGRMDGRTGRAEFIGPSGRAGGPKKQVSTCFKNPEQPTCVELMLTNRPRSFLNFTVVWRRLIGIKYSRIDQAKFVEDTLSPSDFLKAVFHKFYLVHSWIPWPMWSFSVKYTSTLINYWNYW